MHAVLLWLFVVSGFSRNVAAQTSSPLEAGLVRAPKYVSLMTSASATTVKPGDRLSLFVDITPNPGIHVYAPGAGSYLPIALTLRPRAARPLRYPKAELLFFAPLNETVPVYQKPFRLIEDVTVARTAKPGATLTWTGTIDYQACDDKVCYLPQSVPVSWTASVR
jgi:DsbC/DsbD-like thiol-disulfide interchange protein